VITRPFIIHALSPLHAGVGQDVDVIDLPIARLKATGIPFLPGSSIKGVLRDARDPGNGRPERADFYAVFGPEMEHAADHAGALAIGDARLLALPVRSFKGAFAWVTSPLLLMLAARDWEGLADAPSIPSAPTDAEKDSRWGLVPESNGWPDSVNVVGQGSSAKVYLEDLDLDATPSAAVAAWAQLLAPFVAPPGHPTYFSKRLVVVDDESMAFLWETATQVDTRIRINRDTRTVDSGALWTEESLPAETLLIGLLGGDTDRRQGPQYREEKRQRLTPEAVLNFALQTEAVLQFGGKATVGRGRCRMVPLHTNPQPAQG